MNGRLGSFEAEICREALNRRGETLVPAGEERPDAGQRRALALTTLCQDELDEHALARPRPSPAPHRRAAGASPCSWSWPTIPSPKRRGSSEASPSWREAGSVPAPWTSSNVGAALSTSRSPDSTSPITDPAPPSGPGSAGQSSPATVDAPSTAAARTTGWRFTTSSNDREAVITPPKTSPPSAGGTTTWPSTAEACGSTPNPHRAGGACYPTAGPAATGRHPPTPTPSPLSGPSPRSTELHPDPHPPSRNPSPTRPDHLRRHLHVSELVIVDQCN